MSSRRYPWDRWVLLPAIAWALLGFAIVASEARAAHDPGQVVTIEAPPAPAPATAVLWMNTTDEPRTTRWTEPQGSMSPMEYCLTYIDAHMAMGWHATCIPE